jgi:hypothetical protein
LVQISFSDFHVHQMRGDDTKGRRTPRLGGTCNSAHQANITRAIDQTPSLMRDKISKAFGLVFENGFIA